MVLVWGKANENRAFPISFRRMVTSLLPRLRIHRFKAYLKLKSPPLQLKETSRRYSYRSIYMSDNFLLQEQYELKLSSHSCKPSFRLMHFFFFDFTISFLSQSFKNTLYTVHISNTNFPIVPINNNRPFDRKWILFS
jgi:hypothetical protein